VARAADVFDQREEDGIVVLLLADPGPARRDAVEKAALLCPAQAISVVETP
jgi:ferredoxin